MRNILEILGRVFLLVIISFFMIIGAAWTVTYYLTGLDTWSGVAVSSGSFLIIFLLWYRVFLKVMNVDSLIT